MTEEAESSNHKSNPYMKVWLKQLKELHPHIPENLLLHILKTYDEKPYIIDELVEEDKKCPIKPKERPDIEPCLLYTSPSPRDRQKSRMPSSA